MRSLFRASFLFFLVVFMSASNTWAATAQVNSVIQAGGEPGSAVQPLTLPTSSASLLKVVGAGSNAGTGGNYYAFSSQSSPTSTGIYQVPAGKTFYVIGWYLENTTIVGSVQFGYATASFTNGTASAPTGAVYYGASSTVTDTGLRIQTTFSTPKFFPIFMSFPANSYPFVRFQSGSDFSVHMAGVEQ